MQPETTRKSGISSRQRPMVDITLVMLAAFVALLAEQVLRASGVIVLPTEWRSLPALLVGALVAIWVAASKGELISSLGLAAPVSWLKTIAWAVAITAIFIVAQNLGAVLGASLGVPAPDFSRYDYLYGNMGAAIATWALLVFTAALPEELLYRGFLLGRIQSLAAGLPRPQLWGAAGQAVLFGLTHYQWGIGGIVMTTIMGLVWGLGFVLSGRNLWAVIGAHSLAHLLLVLQLASTPPA